MVYKNEATKYKLPFETQVEKDVDGIFALIDKINEQKEPKMSIESGLATLNTAALLIIAQCLYES